MWPPESLQNNLRREEQGDLFANGVGDPETHDSMSLDRRPSTSAGALDNSPPVNSGDKPGARATRPCRP